MARYHANASPLSQPPKSNFRVRAKEPSCPNEKRPSIKRRGHFPPEKPNWLLQTRGMTEMKLAHLNPLLEGKGVGGWWWWWWWGRGGALKRDRDWQRETRQDKWDREEDEGNGCGQVLVQGQHTGIEMKRWSYGGRRWRTELSLGVIRGLISTAGLKRKPSVRVKRTSPHSPSIIKPHPRNHDELFTTHVPRVLRQFQRLCLKNVASLQSDALSSRSVYRTSST